jgi:hypothetical protein
MMVLVEEVCQVQVFQVPEEEVQFCQDQEEVARVFQGQEVEVLDVLVLEVAPKILNLVNRLRLHRMVVVEVVPFYQVLVFRVQVVEVAHFQVQVVEVVLSFLVQVYQVQVVEVPVVLVLEVEVHY